MNFDATLLYQNALWEEKTVYPKIKSGFAFKPHKNTIYVDVFNNKSFKQDGNQSVISKKYIHTT